MTLKGLYSVFSHSKDQSTSIDGSALFEIVIIFKLACIAVSKFIERFKFQS